MVVDAKFCYTLSHKSPAIKDGSGLRMYDINLTQDHHRQAPSHIAQNQHHHNHGQNPQGHNNSNQLSSYKLSDV
jgi:hypothetical protein